MDVELSVVVAVYNEHPNNLVKLVEKLDQVLSPLSINYEVIFVDDGSVPTTAKALVQLAQQITNVRLVVLSRNFGQQAAISAGLDHASGQVIVNIDSDLQDPPELIPEMLKYWKAGYDIVYAQRSSRRDRLTKRLSAFLFYRLLGAISEVAIPWDTGDFRLIDRKVVKALNAMPEKTRFLRGQIPWLGFKQIGIPIDRNARQTGESTYTLKKLFALAMDGILSFSNAPLFFIPLLGAVLIVVGVVLGAVAYYLSTVSGKADFSINYMGVASLLSGFTGIQLLCLGIVSIYLSKTLDEARARPTYIVSEIVGLENDQNNLRQLDYSRNKTLNEGSVPDRIK